jgi:hypothetical protein
MRIVSVIAIVVFAAYDAPLRTYDCPRAAMPVQIDGRLDDPVWSRAPWTADFVDIEGDAKPTPRFRTRVKMLWDDQYYYVGAWMEEPHVWGKLTRHDSVIFHDNDFEVFIDPDGDTLEYYEFEINALNTGWTCSWTNRTATGERRAMIGKYPAFEPPFTSTKL